MRRYPKQVIVWELEGSYRLWAVGAFAVGGLLLAAGLGLWDPAAAFLSLPPLLMGGYLWRENPRETIAYDPANGFIWREQHRGRKVEVRARYRVRDFQALALVKYRLPRRGFRLMMVLLGEGGRKEKLDDRPFAASLRRLGEDIARTVGWEFKDYTAQVLEAPLSSP